MPLLQAMSENFQEFAKKKPEGVPASFSNLRLPGATYRPIKGRSQTTDLAMVWKRNSRASTLRGFLDVVRAEYPKRWAGQIARRLPPYRASADVFMPKIPILTLCGRYNLLIPAYAGYSAGYNQADRVAAQGQRKNKRAETRSLEKSLPLLSCGYHSPRKFL
jgi:hypothetical protein